MSFNLDNDSLFDLSKAQQDTQPVIQIMTTNAEKRPPGASRNGKDGLIASSLQNSEGLLNPLDGWV